jgi:hypothetical protein
MPPDFGLKPPTAYLPWSHAVTKLEKARNYWIVTVGAVGSQSTFRQAEPSVIIEILRAAAGRIAGKGEPPNGSDPNSLQNKIRRLGIMRVQYLNQPI